LYPTDFINTVGGGTFASLLYDGLTCYSTAVTGLSTSPTAENIPDFFVFASASPVSPSLGNGGNGNEYSLTLLSLTDQGGGAFVGSGTLIDSDNVLANTSATLSLNFTSGGNYSFSIVAVPEPSAISLVVVGLLGALGLIRRRR
jgi:hypothetical protein